MWQNNLRLKYVQPAPCFRARPRYHEARTTTKVIAQHIPEPHEETVSMPITPAPVVFIMLDGLRPDALLQADAPHLHAFKARSAHTLTAQSVVPSVTLPCHTSIFHSVPPSRHGITENDWHPMARPVVGLVDQAKHHDKKSAFFYNWEFLRDLNRPGSLYYSYFIDTSYQEDGDDFVAEAAAAMLARRLIDFTFIYLGTIDTAGHAYGWMEAGYFAQIARVDRLVGQILAAAPGDHRVLIHSDHGGHERTHGTEMPEDMTIPWMLAGPGIREDYAIQRAVSLLDTAPTLAALLGVPPVRDWEGTAVDEAFAD
jgi:predicted AlkP superfamily pyrophosphatase or phosphodiesterase